MAFSIRTVHQRVKRKTTLILFACSLIIVTGAARQESHAEEATATVYAVVMVAGFVLTPVSALSSYHNIKNLHQDTPSKKSGAVGMIAGGLTTLMGLLVYASADEPWVEHESEYRASGVVFTVIGCVSVIFGVLNMQTAPEKPVTFSDREWDISPTMVEIDGGKYGYGLAISKKF